MLTPVNRDGNSDGYVIAAARQVLLRDGPDAVTMRVVADEAGVSATAIYRHFTDKAQLLSELVRVVHRDFKSRLPLPRDDDNPVDALQAGWGAYFDFASEQPQYYRLLFVAEHGIRIDRFPDDFRNGKSSTFRALTEAVKRCMNDGTMEVSGPAHEVALSMFAHMHGLVMLHFAGRFRGDDRLFRSFAMRALRRAFLIRANVRRRPKRHLPDRQRAK